MRMWMTDPATMCRQHLLGEHVEIHMFIGTINRGVSMQGYVDNGLLETSQFQARHDALVSEMTARGYNHKSPLPAFDFAGLPEAVREARVPRDVANRELRSRCLICRGMQ